MRTTEVIRTTKGTECTRESYKAARPKEKKKTDSPF
jgi:hypothetical protein